MASREQIGYARERGEVHEQLRELRRRLPTVTADGIAWQSDDEMLRIEVSVTNPAPLPTMPTRLVIDGAVLGAFSPWHALGSIPVESLAPGSARRVALEVELRQVPSLSRGVDFMEREQQAVREFLTRTRARAPVDGPSFSGNVRVSFERFPFFAVEVRRATLSVEPDSTSVIPIFVGTDVWGVEPSVASDNPAFRVELVELGPELFVRLLSVTAPRAGERASVVVSVERRYGSGFARIELGLDASVAAPMVAGF